MNTFSIKESLSAGFEFTKKNAMNVGAVMLFAIALQSAMGYINNVIEHADKTLHILVYGVTSLGFLLIYAIFTINVYKQALSVVRGGQPDLDRVLDYPQSFWNYVGAAIIFGAMLFFGFILFVVPALILLSIFCFTKVLVIDRNLSPITALSESRRLTKDNRLKILGFLGVILLLNIAGLIVFGVGILVSIPVTFFAFLHVYNRLLTPAQI